jgi:hypothetical protein
LLNDTLRILVRKTHAKRSRPTAATVDSRSVKSAGQGGHVGYDAGKPWCVGALRRRAKPGSSKFMVGKTFGAPFGGRGATLEINPAHRAGCWRRK